MPDVDAVLQPPARDFYDNVATSAERSQLDAIIVRICASPGADEVTRFPFNFDEGEPRGVMYNDGRYWLIYRMLNEWTLEVLGIGTVRSPE